MPRMFSNAILCVLVIVCVQPNVQPNLHADELKRGREIYEEKCATCHGDNGEGVKGAYSGPLEGDLPLKELSRYIAETMPEEDPEDCIDEEAEIVTQYMMHAFYTREARLRNDPPKIAFSRMTVDQFHNSIGDLLVPYLGEGHLSQKRGLEAKYYPTRSVGKGDPVIKRIESRIDSDYKKTTPDDKLFDDEEQFAISWTGGLIAPESGVYEIILKTKNGAKLHLNSSSWRDAPLIDNYVTSSSDDHRANIYLRGGKAYPLSLTFFKYKDESAGISLQWIPPNGIQDVIPEENLYPDWCPEVAILKTRFPPDDGSAGYARGTSVSPPWDRATTDSALELLEFVEQRLDEMTGFDRKKKKAEGKLTEEQRAENEKSRFRSFCVEFAGRAFRRPLSESQIQTFVDRQFELAESPMIAVRRVVLLTLKSPQFLYLNHFGDQPDQFDVASRMSMGLYDSIPDEKLFAVAKAGKLKTEKQLRDQAWRLIGTPKTKTKLKQFFHHWLEMERASHASKDPDSFPGFNDRLTSSLRKSLELTIDEIIWSEKSDFRELLTADHIFADKAIAEFYGIDAPAGDGFEAVAFEPDRRSGVLTHPYLMMGLAYNKTTSPIHRGVFIAKSLLGRSLKPPPIDVEPLPESFDPTMTTRERVTHQTSEIACQGCHSVINPLGFSFENYDAVGRFRDTEKDQKINAAANYVTPQGESVKLNGAKDLAAFLVSNREAHRNFIEQLFQHFAKQPLAAYGTDKSEFLLLEFEKNGHNVKCLLVEMALLVARHGVE